MRIKNKLIIKLFQFVWRKRLKDWRGKPIKVRMVKGWRTASYDNKTVTFCLFPWD